MHMKFAFRGVSVALRTLLLLLTGSVFLAPPLVQSHAQQIASTTRSDEFDTTDRRDGQIGGALMGLGYRLLALRCAAGEVMVGANIRLGDALDYLQIACAVPSCANGSCAWTSPHLGMAAGNPNNGAARPAMMCQSNEILSGIRGSVVTYSSSAGLGIRFDYARDIEIECSQMTSPGVTGPTGHMFYPVTQGGTGSWRRGAGGSAGSAPEGSANLISTSTTPPISCRRGGYGATAISVGVANFVGSANHPVVQAVSLYCPRIAPTAPQQTLRAQQTPQTPRTQRPRQTQQAQQAQQALEAQPAQQGQQALQQSLWNAKEFRLMTPEDSMWRNANYAGTLGYFSGTSNSPSMCHGFVAEMEIYTPGSSLCGSGFLQSLPKLPAGTPHQVGDIAVVSVAGATSALHSAIYIGCNLYLQRKGASDIQVSKQSYIDNFTSNEQVSYARPSASPGGAFLAKLAGLKAGIDPGKGTTPAYQSMMTQIRGCFPN